MVDGGEMMFGGNIFSGWFRLELTVGTANVDQLQTQKEWDVCGKECLKKLVDERFK